MQVNLPVELSAPLSGNGYPRVDYPLGLTSLDILVQFTLDVLCIAVGSPYPVLEILSEQRVVLVTVAYVPGLVGWDAEDATQGRLGFRIAPSALASVPGGMQVPLLWRLRGYFGGTKLVTVASGLLPWNRAAAVPDTSGGGTGAVTSVFGRTGAVTAQTGDYNISQITGAVTSVHGRTGAVVAQAGDYNITQITGAADQSFLYAIIFGS